MAKQAKRHMGQKVYSTEGVDTINVDTAGNVGIGTGSPSCTLELAGSADAAQKIRIKRSIGTTNYLELGLTGGDSRIIANGITGTNGSLVFSRDSNTGTPTESMRLDASGNLLVGGTANPQGARIKVISSAAGICVDSTAGTTATALELDVGSNNTTQRALDLYSTANGLTNAVIYSNGNIVNRNNSYGQFSDSKLKENIVDATAKLDDVMQLKVRNFNFKADANNKQIGFIAQEFEQVFPSLVEESLDVSRDGSEITETTKLIKTSVLIPILVKAIQEQQEIIGKQASAIEKLEARLAALESK